MHPARVRVLPTPFLVELRPAPQRSGETLQSAVETQSVAKRGRDAAALSKAACRLPPSFPPTDAIALPRRPSFLLPAHQTLTPFSLRSKKTFPPDPSAGPPPAR